MRTFVKLLQFCTASTALAAINYQHSWVWNPSTSNSYCPVETVMSSPGSWVYSRVTVQTPGKTRCKLSTGDVARNLPGLKDVKLGLALLAVRDPRASITVNENADPSVRTDMDGAAERLGKQAEFRATVFGHSIMLPVRDGRFVFGTWQGIYLCAWGGQSQLDVDVVIVDGAQHMATTSFQAAKRGVHPATNTLFKTVPRVANGETASDKLFSLRSARGVGIAHFLIKHTSAAVCVGSDSPGVPDSLEAALNKVVPNRWNREFFTHTYEGDDDMPGHVKSSLIGPSVAIPISDGQAVLPGNEVYVCEHRDVGGWGGGHNRQIVATHLVGHAAHSGPVLWSTTGPSIDIIDQVPAIARIKAGWLHLCAKDSDVALVLAEKGSDPVQLVERYNEMTNSGPEITAAIAGKTLTLPIADGKLTLESALHAFALSLSGRLNTTNVHVTVMGKVIE